MDNRSGLLLFGVFILLLVFTFFFGQDALANQNLMYGIFAIVGYVVCVSFAVFNGFLIRQEGGALSVWYFGYSIITSIVLVWYMTRCGTLFGFWS